MNNKTILEQAIQKAIDGGWLPRSNGLPDGTFTVEEIAKNDPRLYIYSHDFAKALWGEKPELSHKEQVALGVNGKLADNRVIDMRRPGWQYHLQSMVIADDPIKYLGDNI